MSAPPNTDYTCTITTANISTLTITVSGKVTVPAIIWMGGDTYKVSFPASTITCPGPILIMDGGIELVNEPVSPCP